MDAGTQPICDSTLSDMMTPVETDLALLGCPVDGTNGAAVRRTLDADPIVVEPLQHLLHQKGCWQTWRRAGFEFGHAIVRLWYCPRAAKSLGFEEFE